MKVLTKNLVSEKIADDLLQVTADFISVKIADALEAYVEPLDDDHDAVGVAAVTILLNRLKKELDADQQRTQGYGVEIRKASA